MDYVTLVFPSGEQFDRIVRAQVTGPGGDYEKHFNTITQKQYEDFKDEIPQNCRGVLDIGGGVGRMSAFLSTTIKAERFYVADFNEWKGPPSYGWEPGVNPRYNTFQATEAFMDLNCNAPYEIVDLADGEALIDAISQSNLIFSILSVGFHYPIEPYMDKIVAYAPKDVCCVFNIRGTTNYGADSFERYFTTCRVLKSGTKAPYLILKDKK